VLKVDGKKVEVQRVLKDLSQQELAEKAKVSRTYISKIESGKVNPSISILAKIANALGCSIKDFL
jgi:transcriptional regulator with XRE-family HTH domain